MDSKMDNKKVWIVEDINANVVACSSEGSAYRQALQHYVNLLADNLTKIRNGVSADDNNDAECVYEMVISDLKSLARVGSIDDVLFMREIELFD